MKSMISSDGNQLKVQGANVEGNEESGWTITFTETSNVYMLNSNGEIHEGGSQGGTTLRNI